MPGHGLQRPRHSCAPGSKRTKRSARNELSGLSSLLRCTSTSLFRSTTKPAHLPNHCQTPTHCLRVSKSLPRNQFCFLHIFWAPRCYCWHAVNYVSAPSFPSAEKCTHIHSLPTCSRKLVSRCYSLDGTVVILPSIDRECYSPAFQSWTPGPPLTFDVKKYQGSLVSHLLRCVATRPCFHSAFLATPQLHQPGSFFPSSIQQGPPLKTISRPGDGKKLLSRHIRHLAEAVPPSVRLQQGGQLHCLLENRIGMPLPVVTLPPSQVCHWCDLQQL